MANGKSNMAFAFIWMVILGLIIYDAEAALKTTFLEDLCYNQKTIKLDLLYQPTGILMSLPQTELSKDFDCEVILSPPRESSVVVSIYRYDIGFNDTLTIEDSDRFRIALTGYGYFKDEKKAFISDGRMVIRYQRNEIDTALHTRQGFQFTYTVAKKQGPCYENEFRCNNRLCILKEYVCDGHNHCGDGSDQKTCVPKDKSVTSANQEPLKYRETNQSVLWISIIGVAGAIVFIIVTVFIIVVIRNRKPKPASVPNSNNQNSGGIVPLHSVSSTVPQQQPRVPSTNNVPSAPPAPEHEGFSFYNRVRRSIRGTNNAKPEDVSKEMVRSEVYQVPSMYPNLDHHDPAKAEGGVVNPEFKSDES